MKHGQAPPESYRHEEDAYLSQNNPVSGTPYAVLAATAKVRILTIYVIITWTVQPNPLEVRITIDGRTVLHTQANPASATPY